MKIKKVKRYEIVPGPFGGFRIVDRLKDDFICIPLVCDSMEDAEKHMGKDMDKYIRVKDVKHH